MGCGPAESTQGIGPRTRAAVAPFPAATGTYAPYPAPGGRHLSSVSVGEGIGTSSVPSLTKASFDESDGVLLGDYISSLDARTSVV